ncbi:MAG: ATP-binding protein [Eubacteriales bacterium]|nr:ATP-binding protein [Eubacteriales bacterium]MDD4323259.1 ATP-binding protein [Eubacteriales bacterium]MDD4541257.1 ATP-binding protein [Eubacteriales bacterium]
MKDYIIRERYLERIRPFVNKPVVKVLTGLRRAGKSTLLRMIMAELLSDTPSENIYYLNMESRKGLSINNEMDLIEDIEAFADAKDDKLYFFLDEIQYVSNWERAVNVLRVDYNCDIYITGSNANLLSGELATLIAGRYVQFEVMPFQFKEFLDMVREETGEAGKESSFRLYLELGGMPFLSNTLGNKQDSMVYLKDTFDSIVIKDVQGRNEIRDLDLLNRLVHYVVEQCGQTFSARSIHRYLKNEQKRTTVDTILNYLAYCEEAFIFRRIKRHDVRGKEAFKYQDKYYLTDHGFREALGYSNTEQIQAVLENIVCNELLSRNYQLAVGDLGGKEIDFVAKRGQELIYIQVCYLLAEEATIEREFAPLLSIEDNYPKYVLSMDSLNMGREGIRHMNITDFLLQDKW